VANAGMDVNADLVGCEAVVGDGDEVVYPCHWQGPVRRLLSDDGEAYLYYLVTGGDYGCDADEVCDIIGLGVAWNSDLAWIDRETLASGRHAWAGGRHAWAGSMLWEGGLSLAAGRHAWAGGRHAWAGGRHAWAGGRHAWAGGRHAWAGGVDTDTACVSTTTWVDEW
jgi:hypothetical protein